MALRPEGWSGRTSSFGDLVQVGAAHDDINVLCEAPGIRFDFLDVEIDCQSSDDSILKAGGGKELFRESGQLE
jgi:hypothetical protein